MFEIAEMLGIQDPFKMEMNHRVFLWWQAYKELKLTTLHEKKEYYWAKIIMSVAAVAGNEMTFKDALISFKITDKEQEMIDELERSEKLFGNK